MIWKWRLFLSQNARKRAEEEKARREAREQREREINEVRARKQAEVTQLIGLCFVASQKTSRDLVIFRWFCSSPHSAFQLPAFLYLNCLSFFPFLLPSIHSHCSTLVSLPFLPPSILLPFYSLLPFYFLPPPRPFILLPPPSILLPSSFLSTSSFSLLLFYFLPPLYSSFHSTSSFFHSTSLPLPVYFLPPLFVLIPWPLVVSLLPVTIPFCCRRTR